METIKKDGFNLVRQTDGPDLGYSPTSGVKIIEVDGKAFKSFTPIRDKIAIICM